MSSTDSVEGGVWGSYVEYLKALERTAEAVSREYDTLDRYLDQPNAKELVALASVSAGLKRIVADIPAAPSNKGGTE